ncbi:hypothetical protein SDC9_166010 [bioreactor metagenome]|uniref:Cytochrome c-type biogenesis protein CcmF C-terminal domain-containing protein n=1 Tax=bioreactor metagenome TaxID=1076179 RepID=A0A645FVV3_9ZZZZ
MRQLGATISHLGICIFIVAAMLYGNFERNQIVDLEAGKQKKVIDNYQLKSKNMILENNMNFVKYIVPIEVYDKHGNYVQNFYPYFTVPNNENLKLKIEMFPSVERIGMNDIYIEPMDYYAQNDTLQVNFSVKPFIIFVWCGGIMIVMGILLSLVPVKKQPVLQKKTNSSKS